MNYHLVQSETVILGKWSAMSNETFLLISIIRSSFGYSKIIKQMRARFCLLGFVGSGSISLGISIPFQFLCIFVCRIGSL
jgi:hypothetical protein